MHAPAARAEGAVHPRSRGKYVERHSARMSEAGSSPLAREIPDGGIRGHGGCGFIPARAGNTRRPATRAGWCSVHPRSRGKYEYSATQRSSVCGSSPLAREILGEGRAAAGLVRFIPARAGNTAQINDAGFERVVHPRSRGKYAAIGFHAHAHAGSSPLAREIHAGLLLFGEERRFIPARAGNTNEKAVMSMLSTVHPRSRGKYFQLAAIGEEDVGSSPLARKILNYEGELVIKRRFIPARAGNTPIHH